ncbi:MAG: hypothetical protein O3A22_02240 [Bacteroidetes bacterium]|jgi:hypothetical protein|nr:hypothetical protein [Bacteroidota bacterium]MDA1382697.1 hypothetical protein [Bacteroidota bacterium]
MNHLILTIGFIFIGITMEVIATSILDFIKSRDPRLKGETYLWMLPIYAVVPFIYMFVTSTFGESGWIVKGVVYMTAFYLLELVAGLTIKALVGVSPWNYKNYRFHFKEVICLEYAPVWFIYGVVGEMYFGFLISI